jgi:arylsulfatase A-like enzyme
MMAPGWDSKNVDIEFTRRAVDFIRAQQGSASPFFLLLCSSTPHVPNVSAVIPEFARGRTGAGSRGDMVWLFDWMVGEIMGALESAGKAADSLVFVTSDNGALPGDPADGHYGSFDGYRTYGHKSCGDWRGYKSHTWEGGHREPLIARWPGIIAPGTATDRLCCLNDLISTIADVVDQKIGEGAAEDSVSFVDELMRGHGGGSTRKSVVHHSMYGVFSIRRGSWKLILDTKGSGGWAPPIDLEYLKIYSGEVKRPLPGTVGQLYDLSNDPGENRNLWDSRPEIVRDLASLLDIY